MRQANVIGIDINGKVPKTENVIPTEINDLSDGHTVVKEANLGENLQMESGMVTVKKASETIAGAVYFWEDANGYWHLSVNTAPPEPDIDYEDNPTGTTVIINTTYTVEPNATGDTVIV